MTDTLLKYVLSPDRIDMSHDGIIHMELIVFLLRRHDLTLS